MTKKLRALVIDSERESRERILHSIRTLPALKLLQARTHASAQRLIDARRSKHSNLHIALVNASSDFRALPGDPEQGPIHFALDLQEKKCTPVLIYSPLYEGERLSELAGMFEGTFDVVAIEGIREAVQQRMDKPLSTVFSRLLQRMRLVHAETHDVLLLRLREIVESVGVEHASQSSEAPQTE